MNETEKKAAIEAAQTGMRNAYRKSMQNAGLAWWKKLIWVALAGALSAASCLLSSCTQIYDWQELTPQQQQTLQLADRAYHEWSGEAAQGCVTMSEGGK